MTRLRTLKFSYYVLEVSA